MRDAINCFTIDLEPWMCFYDNIPLRKEMDQGATSYLTGKILEILEEHNVRATFFVVGKIYEWYPDLIHEIAKKGHEIAFHTYSHRYLLNVNTFQREFEKAKQFIKKYNPRGFRAPKVTFIRKEYIPIMRSWGFIYDSSVYASIGKPIQITYKNSSILEIPVTTYPFIKLKKQKISFPRTLLNAIMNFEVPIGSGLMMSLLSPRILNKLIKKLNDQGKSCVMFIHPWQLLGAAYITKGRRLKEYLFKLPYSIRITEKKISGILSQHKFSTIINYISKKHNLTGLLKKE